VEKAQDSSGRVVSPPGNFSLQPVAVEASAEAMKRSKPLM
jgi:hypothetical protein